MRQKSLQTSSDFVRIPSSLPASAHVRPARGLSLSGVTKMKRILVQAGHKPPLQPGHLTQTGAPGEAQLVSDIQQALVGLLNADQNFHPIPMPGKLDDNLPVDRHRPVVIL